MFGSKGGRIRTESEESGGGLLWCDSGCLESKLQMHKENYVYNLIYRRKRRVDDEGAEGEKKHILVDGGVAVEQLL